MGIQFNEETKIMHNYESAINEMGEMLIYRTTRPWFYFDSIFLFSPKFWRQKCITNFLHRFSTKIIEKRKEEFLFDKFENSRKKKMALLDILLSQSNLIDLKGIREEVDTFVFEGHDTTTAALGFIILLLANHRNAQVKAFLRLE